MHLSNFWSKIMFQNKDWTTFGVCRQSCWRPRQDSRVRGSGSYLMAPLRCPRAPCRPAAISSGAFPLHQLGPGLDSALRLERLSTLQSPRPVRGKFASSTTHQVVVDFESGSRLVFLGRKATRCIVDGNVMCQEGLCDSLVICRNAKGKLLCLQPL